MRLWTRVSKHIHPYPPQSFTHAGSCCLRHLISSSNNQLLLIFEVTTQMHLIAHTLVKNLPAVQQTQVWSMCKEDLLENGMATHSSSLAWRILWTEEPGELQLMGLQRVRCDWVISTFIVEVTTQMHLLTHTPPPSISVTLDYFILITTYWNQIYIYISHIFSCIYH